MADMVAENGVGTTGKLVCLLLDRLGEILKIHWDPLAGDTVGTELPYLGQELRLSWAYIMRY